MLERFGRTDEALATRQLAWARIPSGVDDAEYRVELAVRVGDYSVADDLLVRRAADSRLTVRQGAYWWQTISLRQQGRLSEGLVAARRYRSATRQREGESLGLRSATQEQRVLLELGRAAEAVALGDTILRAPTSYQAEPEGSEWTGSTARQRSWVLLHLAESVAATGDTLHLRRLADSLEVTGRASAFGRDQRLHHHLRGLLGLARRDTVTAVRELRAALYSLTGGYTRTNYVLGRVLTAPGHARDAIRVLEPALRGDIQASNLYVTRTELYEALGDAYAKAGDRVKAREAYRRVASAWARGDAPFAARAARSAWLAQPESLRHVAR